MDNEINVNEEMEKINNMKEIGKKLFFANVRNAENQRQIKKELEAKFKEAHFVSIYIDENNAIMKTYKENCFPFCYILHGYAKNIYFKTQDEAMLAWIGHKHLGVNTQFAELAWNMLHQA